MADKLPSPTPEPSGNETAAPKHPDKEEQSEPKKDSKFTAKQIFEFGGLAGVLVVLAEMIGCHDFVPLVIYAVAVNVVILLPLHFVYELLKKRKVWIPILIWIALFMTTVLIVLNNSRPEMKPYPHLALSLSTEDVPDDPVLLTNNFLWRKDFERVFEVQGLLVAPLPHGKTNLVFVVSVRNEPDSLVLAENLKLIMTLPKELACVAGQGWEMGKLGNPGYFGDGKTNAEQTWGFSFSPMLPGFSDVTPPFQISQAAGHGQIYFSILLRAKDSPPKQLTFSLIPISLSSNTPPHKAFVIKGNRISTNEMTFTVQEILDNLRK